MEISERSEGRATGQSGEEDRHHGDNEDHRGSAVFHELDEAFIGRLMRRIIVSIRRRVSHFTMICHVKSPATVQVFDGGITAIGMSGQRHRTALQHQALSIFASKKGNGHRAVVADPVAYPDREGRRMPLRPCRSHSGPMAGSSRRGPWGWPSRTPGKCRSAVI